VGSYPGGKGRLQALHAQGNLEQLQAIRDTTLGRVSLDSGKVFLGEWRFPDEIWLRLEHQYRGLRYEFTLPWPENT
jgi:hypothetical protein